MRPRPDRAYLVCATPRSGSTLLCELLGATGVAGHPLEHFEVLRHSGLPRQPREYFEGVHDFRVLDRLASLKPERGAAGAESPESWWARILADGTTPNGVWAGKLMWGHVDDLLARAGALDGVDAADLDGVLDALLGDVRFVHVTRPDTVDQAVSLWRAVQTHSWRAADGNGVAADCAAYTFEGIDHLRRQIEAHDAAWRRWFAEHGHDALAVSYDELSDDPRGTAQRVLRGLGLPADGVPEPETRRQGDARSSEWAERYRRESGARV
jgi:trehalose 2-sulfotransferase